MTKKGNGTNDSIVIEAEENEEIKVKGFDKPIHIKARDLIRDEKVLVEMFNKHNINIAVKTSGIIPKQIGNPSENEI